jgi:5-methylcytosine-specific restriction protein A
MNFGDVYGEIGKGFIHIHHLIPISEIGTEYKINPITDLIPVCPNCHAMIHRTKQPLTIQELKSLIKDNA